MFWSNFYCFYDLETTSLKTDVASLLECSIILTKDLKSFKSYKFNIQFEKEFINCTSDELRGLSFNKINSQKDLDNHNKNAFSVKKFTKMFISTLTNFFNERDFVLMGFNNKSYDDKILRRILVENKFSSKIPFVFEHSFDLLKFFRYMSVKRDLNLNVRIKYFRSYENRIFKSYSLENIYRSVFNSEFNAHDSLEDTKAVKRIYQVYYNKFKFEVKQFLAREESKHDIGFISAYERMEAQNGKN